MAGGEVRTDRARATGVAMQPGRWPRVVLVALVGLGLSVAAMLARSPAQPEGVSLVATALAPSDEEAESQQATPGPTRSEIRSQFCPPARIAVEDLALLSVSLTDRARLDEVLGRLGTGLAQAAEATPLEVRDDVELLESKLADMAAALAPVDLDITGLSPEQMAEMISPEVATAANHVAATTGSSCG